jgi:CHASE3 domain sensor protein
MDGTVSVSSSARLNTATLGVAALVLLVIVGLSFREWQQYSRANAEAAEITFTVDSVDRLLSEVTDAETSQRGFLLTGEDRTPYDQALQAVRDELATVRNRLEMHPGESGNVARLNSLVTRKVAELQHAIDLRQAGNTAPATALALNEGKRTMDAIRVLCRNIETAEKGRPRQPSVQGEAAAETALVATAVASLGLLFLFEVRLGRA